MLNLGYLTWGARTLPFTAAGILFATLTHSGAEVASCRCLPGLVGTSLWRADNCWTPGTWKKSAGTRLGLGHGREHGSGCKLFGNRWCSFWMTGWQSVPPELFENPFPFPSPCSQVQGYCWLLMQVLWLLPSLGLLVLCNSGEVAPQSCFPPLLLLH